ncbi:acetylxylan esterase [Mucilaginibacter sp. AW1-3]
MDEKMNVKKLTLILTPLLVMLCAIVFAQKPKPKPSTPPVANDKEEIVITEHAFNKNSIFQLNDTIKYRIDLKSTYGNVQDGHISYAITDLNNRLITQKSFPVNIPANGSKQVHLDMPAQKAGFYKVNFMLNVTDDDDTVRRVFGVDTAKVTSPFKTPDDFWPFWDNAKKELAKVPPQYRVTYMPKLSKDNDEIYLVEMQSLGNITIRAWMTLPKDRKPGQKFAVAIAYPGYGGEMHPFYNTSGMIHIGLNIRGLGNSRDVIHPTRDDYINVGIADKDTYIFKGVMMDCVRLNDFLVTRPEVDTKAIFATGGSLGGYLSMATASLDDRIALCSGDNPGYPDIRAMGYDVFPINTMKYYADKNHFDVERSLKTWDYYNLKSFVTRLKCPVVMGIGLLDNFISPAAEMHVYNNIPATEKKLFIFPNLAHEVGPEQGLFVGKWVYDKLHIYEKWLAYNKPAANAAPAAPVVDPNAEVIDLVEHPLNKGAVFSSNAPISYTVDLKSNFKTTQTGKISYMVTTSQGKLVAQHSVPVSLLPKGNKTVSFEIPAQSSGFYNINFAINTSKYDDTLRRAFGVDTNKIISTRPKPADFDAFWDNAKAELAKVAPDFKVTEKPDLEHNDKVYLIEMRSLDNQIIRGYMSLPKDLDPKQKLPVSLALPGYGAQAQPPVGTAAMALISLSVRGQPLSDDVLKPDREDYIITGIEDKNKYILKGVLMDCERLVDFVFSRPELDHTAIYASGASMGGYLALALSGIDKRITIVSANNPVFSDFRTLAGVSTSFPMAEIKKYADDKAVPLDKLLNTLDYFDLQNFAPNITAKTVVGIGMLDNLAPPTNSVTMFNNMPGNKKLFIFPNLAHDIGPEIGAYVGKWVYDKLDIYNKWLAYNKQREIDKVKEEASGSESVVIIDKPANKEAVFKSNSTIEYNVDLKNNFFKKQSGVISCLVYTSEDKFIRKDSISVNIDARTTKRVHFEVPPQKTGFYKINFAINVSDYDDTLKRVFGVNIEDIRSGYPKPADFDQFWANTKKELAAIPPNFKMTEKPELETGQEQIYLIEMQSLGNITVRAWLTLPRDRKPKEKFPLYISLPGYGNAMVPSHAVSTFAFISLNVRGQGNSRDVIHPDREDYISYDLQDINKYIYRGSIMDGVRLLDFVYAHKELFDTESIFVTGGSQGGYLTLALASIDQRVSICEAENPGYIDLKMPYYNSKWPITVFKDYAEKKSVKFETLMDNFEYFNLKNFVPNIKCKVVVGIGLLDPLVPPTNELIMYNSIKAWKKLFIYPNLTHEVDPELGAYKAKWMADNLGL